METERRSLAIMGMLVALNFATVGVGVSFSGGEGKLSLSNFGPVLFVAAAFLFAKRLKIPRYVMLGFVVFNACALLSYLFFLIKLRWMPNFAVLAFQNAELLFAWLLYDYAISRREEFRRNVRIGIILSLPFLAYFAAHDLAAGKLAFNFGMDDKSHAAVILCCGAFILIRYFGKPIDCLIAALLYVLSFMTVSRLPVFFAPALMLAGFSATAPGLARQTLFFVLLCACAALALNGDTIAKAFVVLDRLSSISAVAGEGSTSAHLLLIKKACEIKMADAVSFVIGIGPGNFSKALIDFPVSTFDINAVDPVVVSYAMEGRAPLHSTPFSFLIDYNAIVIAAIGLMLYRGLLYLLANRLWPELFVVSGFLMASTFYSLHNKPYFFLYVAALAALIKICHQSECKQGAPSQEDLIGVMAGSPSSPAPQRYSR